jgi:TatD DNase family protein
MFIDSHCHIHSADYSDGHGAYSRAQTEGVSDMICVGTAVEDSQLAVSFAASRQGVYAAVGVHPHEAKGELDNLDTLKKTLDTKPRKLVAIGEIGLDYFYEHSDRKLQRQLLERQLQLAQDYKMPVIFHVREAFDDFWAIFDNFPRVKGVLHSFTDTMQNAERAFANNLYIGINGIATFTKDNIQQQMFREVPLSKILLETDAPYLTPAPYRGKLNEPAYVRVVAEHIARERNLSLEDVARQTSHNATILFNL